MHEVSLAAVLPVDGRSFFSGFEREISLLLVILVVLDREEEAENVHRLDHLENRADGLRARVKGEWSHHCENWDSLLIH